MNNKGFTLIELMAAIILLTIIMAVTSVSVIEILQNSKEKSYTLLVKNIKIGAQEYFEECENRNIIDSTLPNEACDIFETVCSNVDAKKCATIDLSSLIQYGFLKSSAVDSGGNKIVENPKTNDNMNECKLEIMKFVDDTNYSSWYEFTSASADSFCPTTIEYEE